MAKVPLTCCIHRDIDWLDGEIKREHVAWIASGLGDATWQPMWSWWLPLLPTQPPLDYHQPTALYLCICIFQLVYLYLCICEPDGPLTHHSVFVYFPLLFIFVFVMLMVAFAAHSTPTGLPSTHCFVFVYLYFSTCIFVFVHLWAWWPINPPLCVCVFSFIIHFCICNADGCLCCPLNPTGPPSTHHFVFVNLCFFGVFVKLIVAFADYSNPLDYHQPTALHLCKCVFAFFFCQHVSIAIPTQAPLPR